jgi:hypothetical protein
MSMTGLAARPGTDVLPTWWMPPVIQGPIAEVIATASRSNIAGHRWS